MVKSQVANRLMLKIVQIMCSNLRCIPSRNKKHVDKDERNLQRVLPIRLRILLTTHYLITSKGADNTNIHSERQSILLTSVICENHLSGLMLIKLGSTGFRLSCSWTYLQSCIGHLQPMLTFSCSVILYLTFASSPKIMGGYLLPTCRY